MSVTIEQVVAARQERQAAITELEKRHKEELAPLKEELSTLERALTLLMDQQGVQSVRTPHGTAYRQRWTKAKVIDWNSTLDWVANTRQWGVLARQVSKQAVLDYIDEHPGEEVPGIAIESGFKVNVRRS